VKQPLLLVGGGGHCASCSEVIESSGLWEIAGIIDNADRIGQEISGYPIIGADENLPSFSAKIPNAIVTVGQLKSPAIRQRLFQAIIAAGFMVPKVIASSAVVSRRSTIGAGTIIMHRCVVNAGAVIGRNCIINTGAIVEHDAVIGDDTHISTGSIVNGSCSVGSGCLVGSGAVLRNGVSIADGVIVGAGAVVVSSLDSPGVYVGNPARKIA
jgi:sugar O-acyltransferase (sialic acid O-acetyltransferase NeuD family)